MIKYQNVVAYEIDRMLRIFIAFPFSLHRFMLQHTLRFAIQRETSKGMFMSALYVLTNDCPLFLHASLEEKV